MTHATEIGATIIFIFSIAHSFLVKPIHTLAQKSSKDSIFGIFLRLAGEVELVFGLWSIILFLFIFYSESFTTALNYLKAQNFKEPLFVATIMVIATTKPIIDLCSWIITTIAEKIPIHLSLSLFCVCLILGPILGSFITEPASMAVTGMVLIDTLYSQRLTQRFRYALLGLLFVNVSIGGTLTHYAAPPVVMVASQWGWDFKFMFSHFGWKAFLAISISTVFTSIFFRHELRAIQLKTARSLKSPLPICAAYLLFLSLVVANSHNSILFISVFLVFLGFSWKTSKHQQKLKFKDSALVGVFLAGLVFIGGLQAWWITPIVTHLDAHSLFISVTALTAVFDNAALTYLGSLVPNLSDLSKYALVAGSVTGGGLTLIANAPNPIGYSLLKKEFGKDGIRPGALALAALPPTLIAAACFILL